jgi:TPR repeat protein
VKKLLIAALAAACLSSGAFADTQEGVDAFSIKQFDEALKQFEPAAKAGDAKALYYLGLMYSGGFGVEKDLKKALEYYGESAKKGNVLAQKEYGTALAIGEGTEQNVEEGLNWLFIAARAGHQGARATATRFAKYMRNTVIIAARREAIEWQKEYDAKNGITRK